MKRTVACAVAVAAALAGAQASATVYLAGSGTIFGNVGNPVNAAFLTAIAGKGSVLINGSGSTADVRFYRANGIASARVRTGTDITSALLDGVALYIAIQPSEAYTSAEVTTLREFIHRGGNLLLAGSSVAASNSYVNDLLRQLRIGISLERSKLPWYTTTASLAQNATAANLLARGESSFAFARAGGLSFASGYAVTGGTPLFQRNGVSVLSMAAITVPEPATWAMVIVGAGLVGASLRRRRTVALAS